MAQALQLLGAAAVLVGYALVQTGRTTSHSHAYLVTNLSGSLLLAVLAGTSSQWGFLLLEGAWALISIGGLIRRSTKPASINAVSANTRSTTSC